MPAGIPVATVSISGGRNAGILAARTIGAFDEDVRARLTEFATDLRDQVERKNEALQQRIANGEKAE